MGKARLFLDRNFIIDKVDRRIFSSFLENGEMVEHILHDPDHPTANADGMRQDAIALLKELHVPMLRAPGGNILSCYDWLSGTGPREQRIPRYDCAWGRIDSNQVGLDEYDRLAKELGAEVMPAVNLGTGTPNDARNMIEYTNHPGGSQFSDLRIKHGHEEPYNYKLWCLGNELDGSWQMGRQTPETYPLIAEQAATLMKAVDPEIEVVAVGSSHSGMPTYIEWEYKTLMQAPQLIDYVALHTYYGNHDDSYADFLSQTIDLDIFIRGVIGVFESVEAKLRLDKKFYISVDEWNVSHHPTYNFPFHTYNEERLPVFPPYSTLDALMVALQLIVMLNHADRVKVACLSLLTSLIWARSSYDVLKTVAYYPFQLMSSMATGHVLRQTLETEHYSSKYYASVPVVESASVLNENGQIVIFAVNRDGASSTELELHCHGFGDRLQVIRHIEIQNDDPEAVNTVEHPNTVIPTEVPCSGTLSAVLKPFSFNILVVETAAGKTDGVDYEKLQEAGKPTTYISSRGEMF